MGTPSTTYKGEVPEVIEFTPRTLTIGACPTPADGVVILTPDHALEASDQNLHSVHLSKHLPLQKTQCGRSTCTLCSISYYYHFIKCLRVSL